MDFRDRRQNIVGSDFASKIDRPYQQTGRQFMHRRNRINFTLVGSTFVLLSFLGLQFAPRLGSQLNRILLDSAVASGPDSITIRNLKGSSYAPRRPLVVPPQPSVLLREAKFPIGGSTYPSPELERINLTLDRGEVALKDLPTFKSEFSGRIASFNQNGHFVFYTLDPDLQRFVEQTVAGTKSAHVAVVAIQPESGRILALAGKSLLEKNMALHAGFPAASLFKLVTTTAALEQGAVEPESVIHFRGGNYTLNQWNYLPNARKDRRFMNLSEALGKSCNPVFARVALKFLSPSILRRYARSFGFDTDLRFDSSVAPSRASVPENSFELSRTAAGFGDVTLSPIHAVALMAGIANGGLLPRPALVDSVVAQSGAVLYHVQPEVIQRIMSPTTAKTLLEMMESTITEGTSRKEFIKRNVPVLRDISVSAKTGTLRGDNPAGINNWFIAAAPSDKPTIALAVIVVNEGAVSSKASHIGRMVLQRYLGT